MAEKAIESAREPNLAPIELSVLQACVTVRHKETPLKKGDVIQWNEQQHHYDVYRNDEIIGFLWGDMKTAHGEIASSGFKATGKPEADRKAAAKKGYQIVKRVVETRGDCERVQVPAAFRALFPSFMKLAQEMISRMEEILLEINMCFSEAHNVRKIKRTLLNPGTWQASNVNRFCITLGQKLGYAKDQAQDAVRLVRWFLLKFGAEDPRGSSKSPDLLNSTLPFAPYEIDVINANQGGYFAPAANHMALDFVAALGIGPTDAAFADNAELIAPILDKPEVRARGTIDMFQLEGYMWHLFGGIRERFFLQVNPHNRIIREVQGKYLRPPVQFTTSLVFTMQLYLNGFCTPNSALIVVTRTSETTHQTWSEVKKSQVCYTGRLRPGSFYLQISRCHGSTEDDGMDDEPQTYVDWRVRVQSILVGGNILTAHETGIFGNMFTSDSGVGTALLSSATAIGSGVLSFKLIDKLAPALQNSPIAGPLFMAAATSATAISVLTAASFAAGASSFKSAITSFLHHLSQHGVVDAPGASSGLGLSISVAAVFWGSIVHRVKTVQLVRAPTAFHEGVPGTITTSQRSVSMHFESWNFAQFGFDVPFAGAVALNARVEISWDLTAWYEWVANKGLSKINDKRINKCKECISSGQAFCDWRDVLASEWEAKLDVCVPHTEAAQSQCILPNGAFDDTDGEPVLATFYTPGGEPAHGAKSCERITFTKANQEFKAGRAMTNFFRRH